MNEQYEQYFEAKQKANIQLQDNANVKFEVNKLTINENISIDDWKELGHSLKQVEGSVQFWIGDWARFGEKKGFIINGIKSSFYDELADITGLDRQTIQDYKYVADNVDLSLRNESLTFSHHREAAKLPEDKQIEFLDRASEEKLTVRELREEIRRDNIKTHEAELPTDKYRIIYADPPWKYGNSMPSYVTVPADYYPLMSINEICAMPVKEMAQDNAVLFMWTTAPILKESFEVVEAWGFEYKTFFVWDKVKHNMGHYSSVRHEVLLLCVRGSCPPDNLKLFDSVQTIERTEHSVKPEIFREIIDTIYPNGNRIELFARRKVNNWEVYGNQILS